MNLRKLTLRIEPLGPFWFEDLMFFVIDEARRLPSRAALAVKHVRGVIERAIDTATNLNPTEWAARFRKMPAPAQTVSRHQEVAPLDDKESWALATEPLVAASTALNAAVTLQAAAAEKLDSLAYALAQMRDDLRPIMTYTRFKDETVETLPDQKALDASIEALLELSRKNAATRPKDRVRPAA